MSSGSSRGSLASSRGSLASSRGSLSSISFTDIYGLPHYEPDALSDFSSHMQYVVPLDTLCRDGQYSEISGLPSFSKQKMSLDTPQSLASLSSRSSLSSLSPPSSPLDTPFLSASRDSPLTQMSEGLEEIMGALEIIRGHNSCLIDEETQGQSSHMQGCHSESKSLREIEAPFPSLQMGAGRFFCFLQVLLVVLKEYSKEKMAFLHLQLNKTGNDTKRLTPC